MLKLGRVTKVKVLFLVLVFVFNFDFFKFSAAILEKGLFSAVSVYCMQCKGLCNNCLEGGSKISKVGLKIKLHPPELKLK